MIEVRQLRPEHFDDLDLKEVHSGEESFIEAVKDSIDNPKFHGFTICWKYKPIAVVGGFHLWPGFAEILAFVSKDVSQCPIAFSKKCKTMLDNTMRMLGLNRMQMTIKDGHDLDKWARLMGFEFECLMRKYGPDGSDHKLYGRVR